VVVVDVGFVNDVLQELPDSVRDRCPNIPDGGGNMSAEDCGCSN